MQERQNLLTDTSGGYCRKWRNLELWDDTLVVVLSDHGMSIGEHSRTGKSNIDPEDERYWPTYPEINHEMFLIAGGDVPSGQRLDLIAQPMDIMPTLCELAGVNLDPPKPFEGRSFARAFLNGDDAAQGIRRNGLPYRCPGRNCATSEQRHRSS